MPSADIARVRAEIDALYRKDSRKIFATLIRLLGDFDRAEEALADGFRAAMEKWPSEGIPQNPASWLISAGRFKSIDKQRREKRFDHLEDRPDVSETLADETARPDLLPELLEDDRLRLVFTCCHPALAADAQVALTLREVCDLTTEEIAAAFLTPAPTIAQRIVRAKSKIRDANIPYQVPTREELPARLDSVLRCVYLVFNEGYSASRGDLATRADLSGEAIRLGRLVLELLPNPEAQGLLALMLLHESRREARATPEGELILLDDQDRKLWNQAMISEGVALVRAAFASAPGPYAVQAAIAAIHAEAPTPADTDWREVIGLYDLLMRLTPSPVIALNRTVAVAQLDGPETGLQQLETLMADGTLDTYQLAHAARADFLRRLERHADARGAYARAIALTAQGPARRFLEKRVAALPVQ